MEIERKYLLDKIPFNLSDYRYIDIEQAYISTSPVIRTRKKIIYDPNQSNPLKEEYILTVKSKGLMTREEFELELSPSDYSSLQKKSEGNIISKKRYLIPLNTDSELQLTLELDVFYGIFQGLIIAEIEFPDEESAKKYNSPDYLFREVTFDKRFHNSNLSTMSAEDVSDLIVFIGNSNGCGNKVD